MPLLALGLETRPDSVPRSEGVPIRLRVRFDNVGRGLFPGRGLLCSFVLHGIAAFLLVLAPAYLGAIFPASHPLEPEADTNDTTSVTYLPRLGGGSEGNGKPGGGPVVRRKGSDTEPAGGNRGVSYPGPQAIVSNPQKPTNRIQTILQPALKNPRTLPPLIPLPNIVQVANATPLPSVANLAEPSRPALRDIELHAPVPVKPTPKTAAAIAPVVPVSSIRPVELPKLTLPSGPLRPAVPMAMNAPVQVTKQSSTQKEPTAPALYSAVPTQGTDLQNLISLSPTPSPVQPSTQVPAGESRGTFAISPKSAATPAEGEPGSKQSTQSAALAVGEQSDAPLGNAASEGPAGTNANDGLPIGGKGGEGPSTGKGVGYGNGGTGTDAGRGSATGRGLGSGPGNSEGSGTNGGAAHGAGAFPGITIQGGGPSESAGLDITAPTDAIFRVISPPHIQGNSLVISTGGSGGGGLGVYQALQCGRISTIFVPMPMGNWTLQYCQQQDVAPTKPSASVNTRVLQSQEELTPPDPVDKFDFRRAPLPADRARKTLIIKGVVREDGVVDKLEIYQGVLKELDETALAALSKWKFTPATRGGKSVAVQILVGIQLSGPMAH